MGTKEEILNEIKSKSDDIKLELLDKIVKKMENDQETRKNAFILMTDIYIKRLWWNNAARAYLNAADLAKTFDDKKELFFKAGELFVRTGDYFTAEDTFRKALVLAAKRDRQDTWNRVLGVYMSFARELESKRMQTKAISVYNKILTLNLPVENANQIRDKMADLYEKIGKPREATMIRQQKSSALEADKKKTMPVEEDDDHTSAQDFIGV
jgi:tetratricopeptide (TPR) repeat protein